jgi:hypothetical protein
VEVIRRRPRRWWCPSHHPVWHQSRLRLTRVGAIARKRTIRRGRSTPPRGAMARENSSCGRRGGTPVVRVGVKALARGGTGRTGGLRSLPAKQHAPKARPPPARTVTVAGRHGGLQVSIRLGGRAGRGGELRRTSWGPRRRCRLGGGAEADPGLVGQVRTPCLGRPRPSAAQGRPRLGNSILEGVGTALLIPPATSSPPCCSPTSPPWSRPTCRSCGAMTPSRPG